MRSRLWLAAVASSVLVAGCAGLPPLPDKTSSPTPTVSVTPTPTPTPTPKPTITMVPTPVPKQLPRGGNKVYPGYLLFGYSGYPGRPGQGRMGIGDLNERVVEMEERSQPYLLGRRSQPIMELIATTVHAVPGPDGLFRDHAPDAMIQQHLDVARAHGAILLLNIQPGRAKFLDELRIFEKWLKEPDVGVALDPEWAVGPNDIPGRVYGRTSGPELNDCAAFLADIVKRYHLPEKIMVYHQLSRHIVADEQLLTPHEGVVLIKSVDGIGSPAAKVDTYNAIASVTPSFVHMGFKLFYEEDVERGQRLMTPEEVMALVPQPEYVLFE